MAVLLSISVQMYLIAYYFIHDWKIFSRIYSDGAQQLNTRRHKHTGITAADRGE
jgi:hypothetical protein